MQCSACEILMYVILIVFPVSSQLTASREALGKAENRSREWAFLNFMLQSENKIGCVDTFWAKSWRQNLTPAPYIWELFQPWDGRKEKGACFLISSSHWSWKCGWMPDKRTAAEGTMNSFTDISGLVYGKHQQRVPQGARAIWTGKGHLNRDLQKKELHGFLTQHIA